MIADFIKDVDFEVRYHNLQANQMLFANINQAIKEARGKYFIFYGHDDEMLPHSLETFNRIWKEHDAPNISAIYALAKDQHGKLVGKKYPKEFQISDYWTQFFVLENEAEKFQCFKTKLLRAVAPMPYQGETAMPSMWLWGNLGMKHEAIFINEILRIYHTDTSGSLSKGKRGSNPIVMFNYYQLWTNVYQYCIKGNFKRRLRGIGGYVSYGLLAKKSLREILSPIEKASNKLLIILFFPIAVLYNIIK